MVPLAATIVPHPATMGFALPEPIPAFRPVVRDFWRRHLSRDPEADLVMESEGQVAQFNPEIEFTCVDLSIGMLDWPASTSTRCDRRTSGSCRSIVPCWNISLDQSADGVISTRALHHLPTHAHLESCFRQIARILRPGGALYLVDLGRLKSLKSRSISPI